MLITQQSQEELYKIIENNRKLAKVWAIKKNDLFLIGKKEIVPLSWVDDIYCLGLLTEAHWASALSNLVRVTSYLQGTKSLKYVLHDE